MPETAVKKRAQKDKAQGKSASTQAGEFVREEIHHVREGKHGARSTKQAIAIGLSKARRAGVELPAPEEGKTSARTRRSAKRDLAVGHGATPRRKSSTRRKRATTRALQHEEYGAASKKELSQHAHAVANRKTAAERSRAARKAVRTKGPAARKQAAKKAARTRRAHQR
jgi:hypothetical protein